MTRRGGGYDSVSAVTLAVTVRDNDDTVAPVVAFMPQDGEVTREAYGNIWLTFDELVYSDINGTPFTNASAAALVTLTQTNADGAAIPFTARAHLTGETAHRRITLTPTYKPLPDGAVHIALGTGYYDGAGNPGAAASATYTIDTQGPAVMGFSPAHGSTTSEIYGGITIGFDDRVYDANGAALDDASAKGLITLRQFGASGSDIPFTAKSAVSGDAANRRIYVNPTEALPEGEVYVGVGDNYYDALGNRGEPASATFRVDTTAGMPALSVADASVTEASGAQLAFTVSLDRAVTGSDGTVSVDYATREVTASAGADYTAVSGTLTFAVGEQEKTVNVTVLEDSHDDGGETLELVLSNAVGAIIDDGFGRGTINNADPLPQAWLGRFGRSLSTQVLSGVRERREAARTPDEARVTLGGQALSFSGGTECGTFSATSGEVAGTPGGPSISLSGNATTFGAPDFGVRERREAAVTAGGQALPFSGGAAASGAGTSGAAASGMTATSDDRALLLVGGAEAASLGAQQMSFSGGADTTGSAVGVSGEQALPYAGSAATSNPAACGTLAAAPGANARADILSGADGWYAFDPHALNLHDGLDPYDRSMNRSGAVSARDLLRGASFALTGEQDEAGGTLAWWGRVARSRFEGTEGRLTLDGSLTTGLVGADYARENWLAGLLLTWTDAQGDYRNETTSAGQGELDASLLAGTVYGALQATERLELWGAAGHGQGALTLTLPTGPGSNTDMDWTMAAAGARGTLLEPTHTNGLTLAVVADALWTRTTSAETLGLAAAQADVTQLRLGVEGGWSLSLAGGELAPTVELGLRHDGGDAETGLGVELGGGLAWHHPGWGLSVDVQGRTLVTHAEDGVTDRGLSASFAFDPAPLTALGPSLTVRHDYGGAATGGLAALFAPEALDTRRGTESTGRWAAEAAWGLPAFRERFTGSPHLGVGLQDTGRDLAVGWRLTPAGAHAPDLSFDVKAMRLERDGTTPDHGLEMNLEARW